ncbi:hypothetical protein [Nonomuraea sp. SBT364]|uniref:hypothetical protein n=1 Tax=Nonomuraea sp. SBT364 TaxID=1580530 RepID=UPI00066BE5CE|nr:hypothetical protein [Nonomuraea sp. SBT364]
MRPFRRDAKAIDSTGRTGPIDKNAPLQVMLTEYEWLRQESLNAINNRVIIANFMFGAVALITAALVSIESPSLLTGITGVIFVPQIAKVGLMIWLGEYNRSQRAGKWLSDLEKRINRAAGLERAMYWESALIGNSVHMTYPYLSVVLLLLGTGWAATVTGFTILIALLRDLATQLPWLPILIVLALLTLVTEAWFIRFFRAKWKKIRTDYSKDGPSIWLI